MGRSNRAIKTERTQIHFLSDVLVAVASLDLKVPILCLKNETTILVLQNVQFESLLLLAVRTFTVVTAFKKVTMNTSTHKFSLSPLRLKVLFFLLSRKNNLDRVSPYWQILSVVCKPLPPKNHVTLLLFYQSVSVCKMAGIVNNVYWRERPKR